MTFMFKPAVRDKTSLLIGIAGASGSGKTWSALELATGLAGPNGRIAAIDTESGRLLHYADKFKFDYAEITAPFRPQKYQDAIVAADEAGYDVIIVDSFSHEHAGDGGLLDWASALESSGTKAPGNWKEPKIAHKKMMTRLLQCRAHLIFCLRAEEKIKIERVFDEKKGREVTAVIPVGWQPICEKRFPYELTVSFLLLPELPGVPQPIKLQDQHKFAFPAGKQVNQQSGALLSAWAHGAAPPDHSKVLLDEAQAQADAGTAAYRDWFIGLSNDGRAVILPHHEALKARAAEVDWAKNSQGASANTPTTAHSTGDEPGQAHDERSASDDGSPSPESEAAAEGTQADLLGDKEPSMALQAMDRSLASVANMGALKDIVGKNQAWLDSLDGLDLADANAVIAKHEARIRQGGKR